MSNVDTQSLRSLKKSEESYDLNHEDFEHLMFLSKLVLKATKFYVYGEDEEDAIQI